MYYHLIFFIATFSYAAAYTGSGYAAPLGRFGPKSYSSVGVFGSPGWRVCYSAEQVNTAGTLLCCNVRGYSNAIERWYGIGCSNSGPVFGCVSWGNVVSVPAIQCSGTPSGTMYSWSH